MCTYSTQCTVYVYRCTNSITLNCTVCVCIPYVYKHHRPDSIVHVCVCVCVRAVDVVLFCALTELQLQVYRSLIRSRAITSCLHSADSAQHLRCISALKKLCNHAQLLHAVASTHASSAADDPEVLRSSQLSLLVLTTTSSGNTHCTKAETCSRKIIIIIIISLFGNTNSRRIQKNSMNNKNMHSRGQKGRNGTYNCP